MPRVASCILLNDEEKILILKRSNKVRTYKGLWGGVAGYIEKGETPYETAIKEIWEEAGIKEEEITLLKKLDPVEISDIYEEKNYDWIIYPFLFKSEKKDKVNIDWEHTEWRWIAPSELKKYDTAPHLKEIVFKLMM